MPEHRDQNLELRREGDAVVAHASSVEFSGPLPHPDILEHYDRIVPGLADRIVSMAEKQSDHRRKLEGIVISSDTRRANLGLWFALIVVIASLVSGTYLIKLGMSAEGLVIPGGVLATIVGAFVYQRKTQTKSSSSSN